GQEMKMRSKKLIRLVPFTLLFPLLGSTCTTQPQNQSKIRTTAALRAFASPDELRSYLASQAQVQVGSNRGGDLFSGLLGGILTPTAAPSVSETGGAQDASANAGAGDSKASDPFSTTNIQEEGVDESD